MPVVPLPANPNIDRLKATAKDLRDLVRAGVEGAIDTVREFHPRMAALSAGSPEALAFKLSAAQLTVARHHGFTSWPKLVAHVELVRALARSPHELLGDGSAHDGDELIRLACVNYGNDSPSRIDAARALWRENPALATSSIFAAATVGDHAAVARFVQRDPAAANTSGGPFEWPPLLYAMYSRLVTGTPAHDFVEATRVLLRAGADPNAGFLWDGNLPPFTAITGAIGRGEQGVGPHRDQIALLHALLDAGADANDGQAVYNAGIGNAHPVDDTDWLALLFAHGLGRATNGPWYRRFPDLGDPAALVAELLHDAVRQGFAQRASLLLANGADPNRGGDHPVFRRRAPYQDAVARGFPDIAALLQRHGARPDASEDEQLVGRCLSGDRIAATDARAAREHAPDLVRLAVELQKPIAVIRQLVDAGWDINTKAGNTALHVAAMRGDVGYVTALVELGADPRVHDDGFDATPAGWAAHFGHTAARDYLERVANAG